MTAANPSILQWSRETAGLDLEEAAQKIALLPAFGETATKRLTDIESGITEPSSALLRRMAKQYRRPLLTFFLDEVPAPSHHGIDFRSAEARHSKREEALLAALQREISAGHVLLRAALADEDDVAPLDYVDSCRTEDGEEAVLSRLMSLLEMSRMDFRAQRNAQLAFDHLRRAAEGRGVFVVLKGNLGSYHSSISVETFRGLSIADEIAPLVVINENDARTAWSFSLLHELVHILLGQSGVSGSWGEKQVERFCDDVAGEFLLPIHEVLEIPISQRSSEEELVGAISSAARRFNVSRSMIAYRAFRRDSISRDQLQRLFARFRSEWQNSRSQQRSPETDGGPDYYVVRRHRAGGSLVLTVKNLMESGSLSTTKAARVLGVKPQNVGKLVGIGAGE